MKAAPCATHHGRTSASRSRVQSESSDCTEATGWIACAASSCSTVDLGHPDRPRLAGGDGLRHRGPGLLDGHALVDAVQLVEVDVVGPQPLQRGVDPLADVLGRAVARRSSALRRPRPRARPSWPGCTASRRPSSARPTSSSFAERAVDVGGVDQRDPAFQRAMQSVAIERSSSRPPVVYAQVIPMQPSPIAPTWEEPSGRCGSVLSITPTIRIRLRPLVTSDAIRTPTTGGSGR